MHIKLGDLVGYGPRFLRRHSVHLCHTVYARRGVVHELGSGAARVLWIRDDGTSEWEWIRAEFLTAVQEPAYCDVE